MFKRAVDKIIPVHFARAKLNLQYLSYLGCGKKRRCELTFVNDVDKQRSENVHGLLDKEIEH